MEPLLNIVLPVFAIVGVGYLAGARGLLGEDSSAALNRFVYWVALPALLFRSMAGVDLAEVFDVGFIAGFLGALLVLWLIAGLLARLLFGHGLVLATLHGMNGVYGNSGYMGIPLAITAFGEAAALPAIVATVINTAVVVGIAVVLIELGQKKGESAGRVALNLGSSLVRNPMLAAPALGLLYAATGLDLPTPVDAFTGILGAAAGPCALFAIGLFLVGKPQSEGRGEVALIVAMKLLGQPLLTAAAVFLVLPTDPLWAKTAILMAALPTGAGSFVLAQAYGVYVLRTSSAILAGTVIAVATLSVFFLIFPPG